MYYNYSMNLPDKRMGWVGEEIAEGASLSQSWLSKSCQPTYY